MTSVPKSEDAPGQEPSIDRAVQTRIGDHLRAMYDELVQQPVPDRFRELLEKLGEPPAPEAAED